MYSRGVPRPRNIIAINARYLKIPKIRNDLSKTTERYFEENEASMASSRILWEAFKTVIRGQALSLMIGHKREKRKEVEVVEKSIIELEQKGVSSDDEDTRHLLSLKQKMFPELIGEKSAKRLGVFWLGGRIYL